MNAFHSNTILELSDDEINAVNGAISIPLVAAAAAVAAVVVAGAIAGYQAGFALGQAMWGPGSDYYQKKHA